MKIGNGNCRRGYAELNCNLPYNNKVGEIHANRYYDLALRTRDRVSNGTISEWKRGLIKGFFTNVLFSKAI